MTVSPEQELMILLECAEDAFPTGRTEDFHWHAARPGSSSIANLLVRHAEKGWVSLRGVVDPADGQEIMRPVLTPAGQSRVAQLTAAGVRPAKAVDADDQSP